MDTRPLLDFDAGYVQRALDRFPRQGTTEPWHLVMSYPVDVKYLRKRELDDGTMRFFSATGAERADVAGRDELVAA